MGIFSKKEDNKEVKSKAVAKKTTVVKDDTSTPVVKKDSAKTVVNSMVIKNPRITEKAANISDNNTYTFDVYPKVSKVEIAKTIKSIYGVTPIKINVLAIPTKPVTRLGVKGVKRGGRKAYVTLKKGDKIDFV